MSLDSSLHIFDQAQNYLNSTGKKPTIILKQTEHFGDTIYATPILRHYRTKYPNAAIAFVTGNKYAEIHQHNPHIDKLFIVDNNSDVRTIYRDKLLSLNVDIKLAPAIAFQPWTHPNIFDQYLYNSGIPDYQPLGGRKPVAITTPDDETWVTQFLANNKVDPRRAIALEYHSYSHGLTWKPQDFQQFCNICINKAYVISLAAVHESIYKHTVDGRGMSWRRSAALLNRIRGIVGVSSGMSVLASTCPSNPFIFEINIPESISIRRMGFTENCQSIIGQSPEHMASLVWDRVR